MKIVPIVAQKGGVGKTTLAQCLAIEAAKEGIAVAILDADPQQSAANWGQRREAAGIPVPAVVGLGYGPIKPALDELAERGAAMVMIDTPPHANPIINAALEHATGIVLVTRPGPMDIAALEVTWAMVRHLGRETAAVITQAPPARARADPLARARLDQLGIRTCPTSLSYSLGYPYAQAEAQAVQEREPTSRARAEIAEVWAWLKKTSIV